MDIVTAEQWKAILNTTAYSESREEYIERVKEEGFEIYYPNDHELFLDIDSTEAYNDFYARIERLSVEYKGVKVVYDEPSKSGLPRRHIVVYMPFPLKNHYHRIAYQAVLCSDYMRELLSLFRVDSGDPFPSLFSDKKNAFGDLDFSFDEILEDEETVDDNKKEEPKCP